MRIFLSVLFLLPGAAAFADEGMWLLNNFPVKQVQQKYGFAVTPEWLTHVRLSSALLAGGCSGSFVSENGLIMTNHHCAHSCIEQLSKAGKDYVASGFYAKQSEAEVRCPEIEIDKLTDITDVTTQVNKSTVLLSGPAFNEAQKAEISRIEKSCTQGSETVRCDVMSLYHGGQYHLYKYHRFQDVRLVFAPELAIAFFGGDPDNFNFPRYDLDVSFLRAYENNKPLKTEDYFRWSTSPAAEGDLTFITGHPGKTSRLLTIAELEFQRDVQLPTTLFYLSEMRGMLTEFAHRGPEEKRVSEPKLFGVENGLKAMKGRLSALQDKKFFAGKVKAETGLRAKINQKAAWKKSYAASWEAIAKASDSYRNIYVPMVYLENRYGFQSQLYGLARILVRSAAELPKPNEKRFHEYTESGLPALKQALFSAAPINDDFEIAMLTFSLTKFRENLTADDPAVRKILGDRSPEEIAKAVVKGSHLRDMKVRQALFEGGQKAIDASNDPMIQFARLVDPVSREIRKKYEDELEPVFKQNSEKIAKAQFAVSGPNTYPDATLTLRVCYGQIKGYDQNGGHVNPITHFAGAFERNTGREPFRLPDSWLAAKPKIDLATPLDFASSNDIIGGNSGSPVINQKAEIVGLVFDGNIQSLGGEFGYDESQNRAVSVHSAALIEALRKIYGADRIVTEILGK